MGAITWLTPPGSTLGSPFDPFRFSTAAEVIFINVHYGDRRVEEAAFRDGAFIYPYLSSTIEGDVYSVRRDGGFPDDPRMHVETKAAVPVGVKPWGILYHVDLRALPPATLSTPGPVTLDGLTWWLRERGPNAQTSNIVTLSADGLSLGSNTPNTEAVSVYRGRRMQLPLANVPGYDPSAPITIYARTNASSAGACVVVGVLDCDPSAATLSDVEFARRQGVSRDRDQPPAGVPEGGYATVWRGNVYSPWTPGLLNLNELNAGHAIYVLNRQGIGVSQFDWSGAAPDPLDGLHDAPDSDAAAVLMALPGSVMRDMSKLVIDVAYQNQVGAGVSAWLCELIIWQPGAGA